MDSVDQSIVIGLHNQGCTAEQISLQLTGLYPNLRGISKRSVQRFLSDHGLFRRFSGTSDEVDAVVASAVQDIGTQAGRRYIKGYIDSQGTGNRIGEKRIGESLKRVDPASSSRRFHGISAQTNPQPYTADYFGHRLHMDQNEKLVNFGVTIVAAIDGFSGFITNAAVMPVKNNLVIYDQVFRRSVLQYGLWDQIIVDCGKEFALTLAVQQSLQDYRRNKSRLPYRQIKSTQNNRIERFWVEVNSRVSFPLKKALTELMEDGRLNLADDTHRFCCSQATQTVAAAGLDRFVSARNFHFVPGRGRPTDLMQQNNQAMPIDSSIVPPAEDAAASYCSNGGNLTVFSVFGSDPLASDRSLCDARIDRLSNFDIQNIYGKAACNQFDLFKEYLLEFINVTQQLAANLE